MMSNATTTNAIASAEAMLRQCERDITHTQELMPYGWPKEQLSQGQQLNIVRGSAVAKIWRAEGRQTLAMHPEVVREVSRASSSKFPMEILRTIPYINPMVVFADPPTIDSWRKGRAAEKWMQYEDEDHMRLTGFMLSGRRSVPIPAPAGQSPNFSDVLRVAIDEVTTTHDPEARAISIMCFFDIYNSAGKKVDGEVACISVPLDGIHTFKDLVQRQASNFVFAASDGYGSGYASGANAPRLQWITEVYKIVLGVILYLCSTVLDAERVPAVATKHLQKSIARKPLSLYRIGWTLGAALTKYRQSIPKGPGSQMGDIRHQQDPQHRKCHFRMQWYGPRNAHACELLRGCSCDGRHREWIFIAPYWTHRERLGMAGINMVRRVPKTG
jgi:hypothetical protein